MGPYWYRNFNNFGTTWDFYERLVKELMGNEEVTKQADLKRHRHDEDSEGW